VSDKYTDKRFATRAIWSGTQNIDGSATTPVFLTSTYQLTDERYQGWADGAQHTALYSRLSSINSEAVAAKVAALEGAEDGEAFASGMSAISTTLLALLSKDDHMVASADCYGGTYGFMTEDLPRFGIEVSMADMRDPSSYEAAIQDNTKILYVETLTNPVLKVCDLEAMAAIANKHGLIAIVDNTFATPWACNPISMGFDLVVHSGTKYLGGHSDLIAGIVVGRKDLIFEIFRKKVHLGGAADPHMCYLLERGMRTLHARMPIHAANAAELAATVSKARKGKGLEMAMGWAWLNVHERTESDAWRFDEASRDKGGDWVPALRALWDAAEDLLLKDNLDAAQDYEAAMRWLAEASGAGPMP